jgi:hypothetical protein
MDLGKVSARIRPRLSFEAIDLGFLMVRRWWKQLFLIQALVMGSLAAVCLLLTQSPSLTVLLLWWMKPLVEAFHLQFLGRVLFDEQLKAGDILKHRTTIFFHDLVPRLLWRRFSTVRSFIMPVAELEQLKGKARRQRIRALVRGYRGSGMWLTLLGVLLEFFLILNLLTMAFVMLPQEVTDRIDWNQMPGDETLTTAVTIASITAMFLVMPYYVASGFCLYINRRTWVEGWDIELAFKQIAGRLQKERKNGALGWILAGLLVTAGNALPPSAMAADLESPVVGTALDGEPASTGTQVPMLLPGQLSSARGDMIDILEGPDFRRFETRKVLRPVFTAEEESEPPLWLRWLLQSLGKIASWVANATEIVLWTACIIAMLALARYWPRLRASLRRGSMRLTRRQAAIYGIIPDMPVEPLPDDIPGHAALAWRRGLHRDALSLLYRGALQSLSRRFQLPLYASHTEIESVELCQARCPAVIGHYFNRLTHAWMRMAYGHRQVSDEEFDDLLRGWSFFQSDSEEPSA